MSEMSEMSEPKQYVVPEGHLIQLGADVLDGWEGMPITGVGWADAEMCRDIYSASVMVTRRIPERMVTVELPESVAWYVAADRWGTSQMRAARECCRKALGVDR